jgi:hypothetical protein
LDRGPLAELTNYAGLTDSELAELRHAIAGHRGLDDIFAWGRQQVPPIAPADVIRQDEFTHDVLVPMPSGRWLVYGTT